MNEFLLIVIMHTSRAASHGHEIESERYKTEVVCHQKGADHTSGDRRDQYLCIPVAPLPKK